MSESRYAHDDLLAFAADLGQAAGLPADRAEVHARVLLEADLMGHTTHGLALLSGSLAQVEDGRIARKGEPAVIRDSGAAIVWDGNLLPGTWLTSTAIETACERLREHPVVTVCIRRSAHIACLAAYLRAPVERGHVILIMNSNPGGRSVAPFGAIEPVLTPNPIACGFPTGGDPVLIDISTSTTANGWVRRHRAEGTRFPGDWLVDNAGAPSDDPETLFTDPPGAIQPLGGTDLGYKGFALSLMVEAMTAALAGHGRADEADEKSSPVFIQLLDPEAFGGREAFLRESSWTAAACRAARTRPGDPRVRLPGERAMALLRDQLANGVVLHPSVMPALAPWADKLGVPRPSAR